MADLFELANELSVLLAARRPQWVEQHASASNGTNTTGTGAPTSTGAGVYLQDSPRSLVLVDLRREVHRRTVTIIFAAGDVVDLAGTYRVTIDGLNSDYNAAIGAPADAAALLTQWAASIDGDATVNGIVSAAAVDADGDGTIDTLTITGDAEANYTFGGAVTVGTGTFTALIDPRSATARAWFLPKAANVAAVGLSWRLANGATYTLDRRGYADRFDTAALDRCYVEISDLAGTGDTVGAGMTAGYYSRAVVGPSIDERLAT